jgi:biopolymer transport protein ExbD
MSKVQYKRPSPKLDMNPMVDLAFLLVTFFMLTTTFKTEDPAIVDIPDSHSELKLPDKDMLTITVTEDSKVFFSLDGKQNRARILNMVGGHYGLAFTEEQTEAFSLISGFGVPLQDLGEWLDLDPEARSSAFQPGIPIDSTNNELRDWAVFSRIANPKVRVAVKGDRAAPYPIVRDVLDMLVTNNINRFNLITDLEKAPIELQ